MSMILNQTQFYLEPRQFTAIPCEPSEPRKENRALKIAKFQHHTPRKMTHIELMHLHALIQKYELDPQEVDSQIGYYENKKHLLELISRQGHDFTETDLDTIEDQFENYLDHLKSELEENGFTVIKEED
jgi:hypothetical protein